MGHYFIFSRKSARHRYTLIMRQYKAYFNIQYINLLNPTHRMTDHSDQPVISNLSSSDSLAGYTPHQNTDLITQHDVGALYDIKQFIETNTDTVHHVALLKLIHSAQPDILNENNNGTFVNLKSASKELIDTLSEYIVQINDQSKILAEIESEQSSITNTYFG